MKKRKALLSFFVVIFFILVVNSFLFSGNGKGNSYSFILSDNASMFEEECGAFFDTKNWQLFIRNIYIPGYQDRYQVVLDPAYGYPVIFKLSDIFIDHPVGLTKSTFNWDNLVLSVPCVQVNNNIFFTIDLQVDYLPNSQDIGFYLKAFGLIKNNSGQVKDLVLDTRRDYAFSFVSETYDRKNYDISAESWCTPKPGLCGNYVQVNATSINDISNIPTSGYLSDKAGYEDCANVEVNKVYINKNRDGSYTAFIITNATNTGNCNWNLKIKYRKLK